MRSHNPELAATTNCGYSVRVRLICHLLTNDFGVSKDAVEKAINASVLFGDSLLDHLIEGGVDESVVVEALGKRFGLPTFDLRQYAPTDEVLSIMPKAMMSKHRLLPIDKKGQTLRVVLSNARDRIAVSEATQVSGCMIKPHIALESRINECLRRFVDPQLHIDIETVPANQRRIGTLGEVQTTLQAAATREAVADSLVRFLLSGFSRTTVFVHKKGLLHAWKAGRRALSSSSTIERWLGDSALRSLYVPLNQPSPFLTVVDNKSPFVGKLGNSRVEKFFLEALGEPIAPPCLVAPVLAFGRVVNVIYADAPALPSPALMSDFMLALHHGREAYERLVRERMKAAA